MQQSIKVILSTLLLVTACNTPSRAEDVPAVMVEPNEEGRSELLSAVRGMLNDRPVNLADSALTSSSLLTIERRQHRSLQGRPATGRLMESPERFRLVQHENECVLIHLESGTRTTLDNVTCVPEREP